MSHPYVDGIAWQLSEVLANVRAMEKELDELRPLAAQSQRPVPMILHCPDCRARHVDAGEFATKPHHTHSCQSCGLTWRPAVVHTVGVQFLPGFKDAT